MGDGSQVNQSSALGAILRITDRTAGGDYDVHDSHKSWNKRYTEHYETGVVIHVTSGNVVHGNLNLFELHSTANLLTAHLDVTPINVHIAQKLLALDVHIAPSKKHVHWNVGGGGHHTVVGEIRQEAQAVRITSRTDDLEWADARADVSNASAPAQRGNMTLEAARAMSLRSNESMKLESPYAGTASLKLNDPAGQAILRSTTTTVEGTAEARIAVGPSSANVQTGNISLNNGQRTTVVLDGPTLTTVADNTYLNGRVHIGDPSIRGMALQAAVDANTQLINDADAAQTAALRTQINVLRSRTRLAPLP